MAFLIGAAIRAGKQAFSAHQDLADPSRPDAYTDRWGNPRDPGMVYDWVRKTEEGWRVKKEARKGKGPGPSAGGPGAPAASGSRDTTTSSNPRDRASGQMDKSKEAALDREATHAEQLEAPPPYSPSSASAGNTSPPHRVERKTSGSSSSSDSDSDLDDDDDDDPGMRHKQQAGDENDEDKEMSREEYEHYRSLRAQGALPAAFPVSAHGAPAGPAFTPSASPNDAGTGSSATSPSRTRGMVQGGDVMAVPVRDPRTEGQRIIRYPEGMWNDKGLRREFRRGNKDAYKVLKKQRKMESRMARYERRLQRRMPQP